MIGLLKKITRNKSIYIIIFFAILYIPNAIYLPAESNRRLVVAGVGLDKINEEIEISLLMVVPKNSGNVGNNYQLISRKGNTLAFALNEIGLAIGKNVSFAHCELIIASSKILEDDLATYLDFFIRSNNLTSNADLVCAENAKEILHANMLFATEYSITLKDIFSNDKERTGANNVNINSFFRSYLNEGNSFLIPFIKLATPSNESAGTSGGSSSEESNNSSGGSSGASNSSSESNSNNGKDKIISYDGSYAILKNGRKVADLDSSNTLGFLAINPSVKKGIIEVENVSDSNYTNSTLTFEILEKNVEKNTQFINNRPFISYNIFLFIKLEEIFSNPFDKNSLKTSNTIIHKPSLNKLTETINLSILNLINLSKEHKVDIFNVINDSYAHHYSTYKEYLKTHSKEDLITNAVITCNYEIAVRN